MREIARIIVAASLLALSWAGSPAEWRNRTIYQVITDRFNNPSGGGCDLHNYCGGTLQGLQQKLDYISGMGFDAIWISPIVVNTPGGYHGYWMQDVSLDINPHFGSQQDMKNLVAACHSKNIWVMVDVVANHMGPADPSTFTPFNNWDYFHDCNGCPANCQISDWQDQPQVQHCKLAGLPDLNQTDSRVGPFLVSWAKQLVQTYNLDGLRIDTVPEVNKPFWRQFNDAAGVYAVGEVFNGDVSYVSSYQGSAVDGLLSYPMYFTLRSVFTQQQSMNQIQGQLQAYKQFPDASVLGTFIDNHDNVRFLDEQKDVQLYKAALTYVLLADGIPIIYYGTEQLFDGGSDPNNREPLWPTNFNENGGIYQWLKTVIGFTKQAGIGGEQQIQRYSDDSFYAFTRGTVFVALTNEGSNSGGVERTITYHPYTDGTKLCNIFYPTTDCMVVKNKQFDVYLEHGESKIYHPV